MKTWPGGGIDGDCEVERNVSVFLSSILVALGDDDEDAAVASKFNASTSELATSTAASLSFFSTTLTSFLSLPRTASLLWRVKTTFVRPFNGLNRSGMLVHVLRPIITTFLLLLPLELFVSVSEVVEIDVDVDVGVADDDGTRRVTLAK